MRRFVLLGLAILTIRGEALVAQNAVSNADFDDAEQVAGWTLDVGSWLGWSDEDSEGCAGSGALWGTSAPVPLGSWQNYLAIEASGCLEIPDGADVYVSFAYQTVATQVLPEVSVWSGAGCAGGGLYSNWQLHGSAPGWVSGQFTSLASQWPGAKSAQLRFYAATTVVEHDFSFFLDRVHLGTAPSVFADDFEGGGATPFCRWSSVSEPPPCLQPCGSFELSPDPFFADIQACVDALQLEAQTACCSGVLNPSGGFLFQTNPSLCRGICGVQEGFCASG